jgi:hypothetical protein
VWRSGGVEWCKAIGRVAPRWALVALVVLATALAGCKGGDHKPATTAGSDCGDPHPPHVLVYRALPSSPGTGVSSPAVDALVKRLCDSASSGGGPVLAVHRVGADRIEIGVRTLSGGAALPLGASRLAFYDWEPNLRPAHQQQPTLSIREAVRSASNERPSADKDDIPPGGASNAVKTRLGGDEGKIERYYDGRNDTAGDKYYLFDRKGALIGPGQTTPVPSVVAANEAAEYYRSCAEIDADHQRAAAAATAGPAAAGTECRATLSGLAGKGKGPPAGSTVVKVPRGIVVVKDEARQPGGVGLGYWILEDDSELSGADITNPKQAVDPQTNEPIVTFGFTGRGKAAFARVTKREAERGQNVQRAPGQPAQDTFQRFAIALDHQLVSLATVSYIDNPEGIDGETGAQINGIGSIQATRDLAKSLATGPLPFDLVLIDIR